MSELNIYGTVLSQPTRSVLEFCKLSGIEFTYHDVNILKKENLTEEFTNINPHQEIPVIVHNGFNVWESAAEVAYLADAYNIDNSWYPKDIQIRARINSYLHWHHQNVRVPLRGYIRAKVINPKFFGAPELTEEQEAPFKEALRQWYETFTWLLAETQFVARTQHATIADVFAYNEVVGSLPILDLEPHPTIKAWMTGLASIPSINEYDTIMQEIVKKLLS